jgi:AraC-like DNA-binding protein
VVLRIRTRSLSMTQQLQSSLREAMTAERTGGARFGWRATHAALGDIAISSSAYSGALHGHAPHVSRYWLSVATASGGRAVHGNCVATYASGSGTILSPGAPVDVHIGDGFRGFLVGIPAPVVATAMTALHGRPVTAPRFDLAVDYRVGAGADVARLVRFLVAEIERDSALFSVPAIAARLEETLAHAILRLPHALPAPSPVPPRFALRTVRRVEEYIASHATHAVTLAELARVAGTSVRTLHVMFQRHRKSTPMEFLRARRFEIARARLASHDPATIAEIALDCGFTHLGRFSTAYRARFGERPTQTRASPARTVT